MNTAIVSPIHSSDIYELSELFNNLQKPYGKDEIIRFNRTYQHVYPRLSRTEKHHAERLVDTLIDNLEHDSLASKIYGVV